MTLETDPVALDSSSHGLETSNPDNKIRSLVVGFSIGGTIGLCACILLVYCLLTRCYWNRKRLQNMDEAEIIAERYAKKSFKNGQSNFTSRFTKAVTLSPSLSSSSYMEKDDIEAQTGKFSTLSSKRDRSEIYPDHIIVLERASIGAPRPAPPPPAQTSRKATTGQSNHRSHPFDSSFVNGTGEDRADEGTSVSRPWLKFYPIHTRTEELGTGQGSDSQHHSGFGTWNLDSSPNTDESMFCQETLPLNLKAKNSGVEEQASRISVERDIISPPRKASQDSRKSEGVGPDDTSVPDTQVHYLTRTPSSTTITVSEIENGSSMQSNRPQLTKAHSAVSTSVKSIDTAIQLDKDVQTIMAYLNNSSSTIATTSVKAAHSPKIPLKVRVASSPQLSIPPRNPDRIKRRDIKKYKSETLNVKKVSASLAHTAMSFDSPLSVPPNQAQEPDNTEESSQAKTFAKSTDGRADLQAPDEIFSDTSTAGTSRSIYSSLNPKNSKRFSNRFDNNKNHRHSLFRTEPHGKKRRYSIQALPSVRSQNMAKRPAPPRPSRPKEGPFDAEFLLSTHTPSTDVLRQQLMMSIAGDTLPLRSNLSNLPSEDTSLRTSEAQGIFQRPSESIGATTIPTTGTRRLSLDAVLMQR